MFKKSLLIMLLMAIFAPWTAVQKTLPYNYGFENNDLAGEGWSIVNGATGYYTTGINAEAAQTGDYGFMFFYSTNPPQYLITPELNGTDNGVEVTFYYKNCSTYEETFTVGYSTTTSETTAFTWDEDTYTAPSTWTEYSKTFPTGTKYVSVKYTANNQFKMGLDDFSFTVPSSCPKPTALTATNVTNNSATLGWTSNADSWNLQYKAASDADWTLV